MPTYEYYCEANGHHVDALHEIGRTLETWGELCEIADHARGDTDPGAGVRRVVSAPGLSFPKGNSALKGMGFTKLVKREKGVYENVTATGEENRYVKPGDQSTYPDFKNKIGD